jgi:hypothetical protein
VNAATFTQSLTPVTVSASYSIYIVAVNVVGSSPPSTTLVIVAAIVPTSPVNLIQVVGSNSKTAISLQWTEAYNGGSTTTGY